MEAKHSQGKQSRRNQTLISGTNCPQPMGNPDFSGSFTEAQSFRDTPGPLFAKVMASVNRHFQDAAAP